MADVSSSVSSFQKGFSEWWNEETEHVFQRIERWAAFARGYNRLRSGGHVKQGSLGPATQEDFDSEERIWSHRGDDFRTLKRPRAAKKGKKQSEDIKINCCGTFNYKSNGHLDSNCLDIYSYDHSIYFKTVGDIRNSRKAERSSGDENENWERRPGYSNWGFGNEKFEDEIGDFVGFSKLNVMKSENACWTELFQNDGTGKEDGNNNYEEISLGGDGDEETIVWPSIVLNYSKNANQVTANVIY